MRGCATPWTHNSTTLPHQLGVGFKVRKFDAIAGQESTRLVLDAMQWNCQRMLLESC